MKIGIIIEEYYPALNGVSVLMKYFCDLLAVDNEVYVFCTDSHGSYTSMKDDKVVINRYSLRQNRFFLIKGDHGKFLDDIIKANIDILIVTSAQCVTTNIVLKHIKQFDSKLIFYSHGFSGYKKNKFAFRLDFSENILGQLFRHFYMIYYYIIFKRKIRYFDHSIFISEYLSDYQFYSDLNIINKSVIHNFITEEFFYDYMNDYKLPKEFDNINKYILNISNYQNIKNQIMLLKAYYKIRDTKIDLVFIGSKETDYLQTLKNTKNSLDNKHGYKNVHFLVNIQREYFRQIYDKSEFFVLTSKIEQYPMVIIESMARKKAFISTDVGNLSYLPGGKIVRGLRELISTIDLFCSNKNLIDKLGAEGFAYAVKNNQIKIGFSRLKYVIDSVQKNTNMP